MKPTHPAYRELLKNLPKINRYFDVEFLALPDEKIKIVKLSKHVSAGSPLLIILAGCHGEEPAPALAIFKNYKLIAETANQYGVNLISYPLVNPWGFDRNKRLNRRGRNCNCNWVHKKDRRVAIEVKTISADIKSKKIKPLICASLREDATIEKEFYMYSFGDRKCKNSMMRIGGKYFPIFRGDKYNDLKVKFPAASRGALWRSQTELRRSQRQPGFAKAATPWSPCHSSPWQATGHSGEGE